MFSGNNTDVSIKVLYISHESDTIGGAFFSLLNLMHSLKEKVEPIVIIPGGGKASENLKNRGIKYFIVPFKPAFTNAHGLKRVLISPPKYFFNFLINYNAKRIIKNIIQSEKVHLIHSNSSTIDIGIHVAEQMNIKHVWHLREFLDLDFDINPFIGWKLFLKKINRSNAIISVTTSVHDHFKLGSNPNAHVLFNAVRLRNQIKFYSQKGDYLLFCGRVIKNKGVEDAIKAFATVHKKHNHLKLVVAGIVRKNYFNKLQVLINQLGITNAVDFVGFQENIDDLMAGASCFLMCSKNEALGRVTVEAMFNGCPVIGHATGGTNEIVKDNETGFLYHTVNELADKIIYVIENKEYSIKIAKQAQGYAMDNFTEETYSKSITELYQKLLMANS